LWCWGNGWYAIGLITRESLRKILARGSEWEEVGHDKLKLLCRRWDTSCMLTYPKPTSATFGAGFPHGIPQYARVRDPHHVWWGTWID
jgi:hypothetical protein